MEGDPFMIIFFEKKSHNAEKIERGDPLRLFNIHSVAEHQKMKGDLLGNFFRKKFHNACRRLPPVTEITILHRQENKIQHRVHYQYTEYRLWTLKN